MRDEHCPECEHLWKEYEAVVHEFFKLESQAQVARLSGDYDGFKRIGLAVEAAAIQRSKLHAQVRQHSDEAHQQNRG